MANNVIVDSIGIFEKTFSKFKNSISRFIEVINLDEGVRRSLISSLKLQDESLLDEYLQTLEDSFIVE